MDRDRNAQPTGGREHGAILVSVAAGEDLTTDRCTHPETVDVPALDCVVEPLGRLARHAKRPVVEGLTHVLARATHHGKFEIVDAACAVHHQSADRATLEQIHDDRCQADLDQVSPEPKEDSSVLFGCTSPGIDRGAQLGSSEDVGQVFDEARQRPAGFMWLRFVSDLHLTGRRRAGAVRSLLRSIGRGGRLTEHSSRRVLRRGSSRPRPRRSRDRS